MPLPFISPESFSSFGDLLKHLRLRAGLTQRELAIAVGYNFAHLSRLEHNQRIPDAATVKALFVPALGLNAEPAWAARLLELAQAARSERRPQHLPPAPTTAPGTATPATIPPALPHALTPLVGRQVAVEAVEAMLSADNVRLLTLLGPPGIGKTRLAQQVALDLADQFADGARFVDLTTAHGADDVVRNVNEALGLREAPSQLPEQRLVEWLGGRELLMVLDNFEQVVASAPLLSRWLQAAPDLTLLVTSREALRVAGEYQFPVPTLSIPAAAPLSTDSDERVAAVAGYAAVDLFVQRARTVRPDFALTPQNAGQVAELCLRLDGLPLALELAAARMRHLSLAAMLERLDRRLQWLTGGPRDGPAWRQTLRGALDWSYDLLNAEEQFAFRHLAVFAGTFTAEALEAVLGGTALSTSALDLLLALADKSLIQPVEDTTSDSQFALLETLREYVLEKLSPAEAEQARARQAAFYLALAQTGECELAGPQQQAWLRRLEAESPNWRAALDWCTAHAPGTGLGLAAALRPFWQVRGLVAEGRKWLDGLLARANRDHTDPRVLARGACAAALLASAQGNTQRAERLAAESLEWAHAAGNRHALAEALGVCGSVALAQNDYARAVPRLAEALALHRELGDQAGAAVDLNELGIAAKEQGDYARATTHHEAALALSRGLGNTRGIITALAHLSIAAYWQGDVARVTQLAEECLTLCRQINARNGIALALDGLAMATHRRGEHAQAREWLAEALTLYEETGNKGGQALVIDDLGTVARAEGDQARAVQMHRKALALAVEIGERRRAAFCLEGLGAALAESDGRQALELVSGAQALRQAIQAPLPPTERAAYEALVAQLREQLSAEAFAAAWAAGQARSLSAWLAELPGS